MSYTNFLIYNLGNKLSKIQILEKLKEFYQKENYHLFVNNEDANPCELQSKISVIFSENTKFISLYDPNIDSLGLLTHAKSYIRKLSKVLTLPVFAVTSLEEKHMLIQQYHFNKRIYDYISIGKKQDVCLSYGYEWFNVFQHQEIWQEYLVGRNNLQKVDKIIQESNSYADIAYVIEAFFKMYGIKPFLSLYQGKLNQINEADACYIFL